MKNTFEYFVEEASKIVVFSGAGISTESGIPDFRSPDGIWSKNRTVYFDEFLSSESARVEYWRQKVSIWQEMSRAKPNKAHLYCVELFKRQKLLGVITQNIEGLHQLSGIPETHLVELHGTMRSCSCLSVDCEETISMDDACRRFQEEQKSLKCLKCEGLLKPSTISFGQALNEDAIFQAGRWTDQCDLFLVLGSSLVVQPAASFPEIAKRKGSRLVIVNREPTPLDSLADLVLNIELRELFY